MGLITLPWGELRFGMREASVLESTPAFSHSADQSEQDPVSHPTA